MAHPEHLAKLNEGTEAWNRWREEHPDIQPDLQKADLSEANLQQTNLAGANLQKAILVRANLQQTNLYGANLREADLLQANLQKANLSAANLQQTNLVGANLQQTFLGGANLQQAFLGGANLQKANLRQVNLQQAILYGGDLREVGFDKVNLQQTNLVGPNLQPAFLRGADLREADLRMAQLKGARLEATTLGNEKRVGPRLADCQWGDVNLAVIKWSQVKIPGDEYVAQQKGDSEGKTKEKATRLSEYEAAVRANRQLAVALQAQGLNEAARFAYRAQVLQKSVLWYQMTQQRVPFRERMQALGAWLFSWFLFLLAGYGYRPARTLVWYLFVIAAFTTAYAVFGHLPAVPDALVFSFMSLHGRGFFPSLPNETNLHNPLVVLAAAEAVIGLFIEISFVATFTQRFLAK